MAAHEIVVNCGLLEYINLELLTRAFYNPLAIVCRTPGMES